MSISTTLIQSEKYYYCFESPLKVSFRKNAIFFGVPFVALILLSSFAEVSDVKIYLETYQSPYVMQLNIDWSQIYKTCSLSKIYQRNTSDGSLDHHIDSLHVNTSIITTCLIHIYP